MRTDDNRMVQGLVTTADAKELLTLTVWLFAESTVPKAEIVDLKYKSTPKYFEITSKYMEVLSEMI